MKAIQSKVGVSYHQFMSEDPKRDEWKPALRRIETDKFIVDDELLKNTAQTLENNADVETRVYLSEQQVVTIVCQHLKINKSILYNKERAHAITKKTCVTYSLS